MCSAAALPKIHQIESDVRQFSIGSKWLYEADSRFDAAAYSEGAFRALDAIESCGHPTKSIGELCGTIWHPVQTQARSNFKRIYTKPEHGVPFVSSRNMFFLPLRPEKFLSYRMKKLNDLMIPRGWVVVSRSGTVGNVLFINKTLERCAISDHTIRIEPVDIPSGYLYAFLASEFGKAFISSSTYGSTVDELEPKHLASILIPLPPKEKQNSIHEKILRAYALRDMVNQLLDTAEQKLYELLEIDAFTEDDIEILDKSIGLNAFSISFSDLVDRLDATNYVPIVRSAINKLRGGAYNLVALEKVCSKIFMPARFKRNYAELSNGVPYMLPSQICLMRASHTKALSRSQAKNSPQYLLEEGELLVTTDGTVGRVHPITKRMAGWFGSNNMVRLWDKNTDMGFLYAYLATPYGVHQLRKDIYGGVVDHINEAHIAAVLCPGVPLNEQVKIGDVVRSAFQKKDEANVLEDEAIAELEAVITG